MQNPLPQPIPTLEAIASHIQSKIQLLCNQHPNIDLVPYTKCLQIIEAGDNSGCLNLIISIDSPDLMDASDFTAFHAYPAARDLIMQHAGSINSHNPGSVTQTALLQANAQTIFNHIERLNYFNATILYTDLTLYINITYNQQ